MTVYKANLKHVIQEIIDGEAVIINMETGMYFSLQGCGATAWECLTSGATVDDIAVYLSTIYDGSRDAAEEMSSELVGELVEHGLIGTVDATERGAVHLAVSPVGEPLQKPRLETYNDMQDLLLLDPIHEADQSGWPQIAG
jgi:hypothetical protein